MNFHTELLMAYGKCIIFLSMGKKNKKFEKGFSFRIKNVCSTIFGLTILFCIKRHYTYLNTDGPHAEIVTLSIISFNVSCHKSLRSVLSKWFIICFNIFIQERITLNSCTTKKGLLVLGPPDYDFVTIHPIIISKTMFNYFWA